MNATSVPFSPIAVVGTITLLAAYLIGAWCVAAEVRVQRETGTYRDVGKRE